ncbi:MAG: MFS transporter [Planctomycetes bacterium]|nr:MFS transporter [Planctomycetota bacterium]
MPLIGHVPALRHRNYRLLWIGQLVSTSGSMMQNAAVLWHVSLLVPGDMRDKAAALGLVGLVKFLPIVLFSLLGGVVADAVDRRKLMLLGQAGMTLCAGLLAIVTFRGLESLWPVYLLVGLHAAFSSFDGPARQALIPSLVPRELLGNALNLNTILFHASNVVGPPLAGLVIARFGVGWVYFANAVSFLAVIAALCMMRGVDTRPQGGKSDVSLAAAWEGLRFVFSMPMIRSTMLIDFVATFFSSATALLPIFVQDLLHVGAAEYGLLYAAQFWGAFLVGLLLVKGIDRIEHPGRAFVWAVLAYGAATIGFGLSQHFWLSWAFLALVGAADMLSTVIRNVLRQTLTPDHLRGRMTSVSMIFFMGGPQLGEVEAGYVAKLFGPVLSVVSGGIACIAASTAIAWGTPALWRHRRGDEQRSRPA